MILFALADNEKNSFGTPFFGKYTQKVISQDFIMNCKRSDNDQPAFGFFTALIENHFTFFSFKYQINAKKTKNFQNQYC